ncbi:MAG TPA: hypothetical protein PLP48_00105 [Acholeplasmataceae bacterium]|nr:hypothetical protein [Acholeplasmataceae bacterium]
MKKIIFTIDVEGHKGNNPVEKLIWGIAEKQRVGIEYFVKELNSRNIKGIFFVDFAEAWSYGKDKISDIVNYIVNNGHNVGMHIHPDHIMDKNRLFLFEYSYFEQKEIITKCTDLYIEILGYRPISFRAGKYGANHDTLRIIDELGYKFDFSQFYKQKWCGIVPEVAYVLPQNYNRLVEFPVTVFKSFDFLGYKKFDKIDSTMNYKLFKRILREYETTNDEIVISLFYHSFSFLDWKRDPDNPKIINTEILKFKKSLDFISKSNFKFISEFDLVNEYSDKVLLADMEHNIVKIKPLLMQIYYLVLYEWSIRKTSKKARIFLSIIFLMIIICLAMVWQVINWIR